MAETSHRSGSQDSDAKPSPRLLEQIAIERKAITRQATYGTFKVESIHGRLFELETYLECIHTQSTKYMFGVFFCDSVVACGLVAFRLHFPKRTEPPT